MIDEKEHGGVMEIDKELMTKIYDLRRRLHSIPEASMHEMRTKAMLMSFLRENTDLEIVDRGAWFYAVLKSSYDIIGDEERTPIAFRADMDAVCGQDGKPGHYCGHDVIWLAINHHTAVLSLDHVTELLPGRVITLEYENFYMVTVYTPNSQNELARLDYRMKWEDDFRAYLKKLEENKPVIVCGDMNVAHNEIDLKNPKTNRKNAGFTDEEREKMTVLLDDGFIDTFRYFYQDQENIYSWWSYRFKAREKNAGWRIDYFLTSESLKDKLVDAKIHTDIMGSDHCPVELDIDL